MCEAYVWGKRYTLSSIIRKHIQSETGKIVFVLRILQFIKTNSFDCEWWFTLILFISVDWSDWTILAYVFIVSLCKMKPSDCKKRWKCKEPRWLVWPVANGRSTSCSSEFESRLQRHDRYKDKPTGEIRCKQEVRKVGRYSSLKFGLGYWKLHFLGSTNQGLWVTWKCRNYVPPKMQGLKMLRWSHNSGRTATVFIGLTRRRAFESLKDCLTSSWWGYVTSSRALRISFHQIVKFPICYCIEAIYVVLWGKYFYFINPCYFVLFQSISSPKQKFRRSHFLRRDSHSYGGQEERIQ